MIAEARWHGSRRQVAVQKPSNLPQQSGKKNVQWSTRHASRKSGVAHTRFISSAVKNPAVTWRIGSKPNVNSHATRSVPQVSRLRSLIKQQGKRYDDYLCNRRQHAPGPVF